MPGPTTTWSSPSPWPSCWPACGPCCAGVPRARAVCCGSATSRSTSPPARPARRTDFALTRIEFDLLEMFLRHPRQVLTREVLLEPGLGLRLRLGDQLAGRLRRVSPPQDRGGRRAPLHPHRARRRLRPAGHVTFRTRLVLATTVAVVIAVLAASLGSFAAPATRCSTRPTARSTPRRRRTPGRPGGRLDHRRPGRPGDRHHGRRRPAGGGLPVTGQARRVAVAPARRLLHHRGRRRERDTRATSSTCRRARASRTAPGPTAGRCRCHRCSTSTAAEEASALPLGAVAFVGIAAGRGCWAGWWRGPPWSRSTP